MTITIRELDPGDHDAMVAWQSVRAETERDLNQDPPAPVEELRSWLAARTTKRYVRAWLAWLDDEAVGEACFEFEDDDDNRHILSSDWVAVRPGHRRRGVADALLRDVLTTAQGDGMTSLLLWGPETDPDVAKAYAERLGLTAGIVERCSRAQVSAIDPAVIDDWIRVGANRTDGYRLVRLGPRCPDDLLSAYLDATSAMADMPTDDLEWQVPEVDEGVVRSRESMWEARGLVPARCLAVAPDGSGAGVTELFINLHRPSLAEQGDTAVVESHRGHGLGRWLKAENLRYAQDLSPGFEVIETFNAQSNPWMLDINVAMGFRPHRVWRGFQGDLAHALSVVRA